VLRDSRVVVTATDWSQRYLPCRQPTSHTSHKICGGFLYGMYRPGNNFELIPMEKMETRHPVEGSLGNEFPSVCNHCGVMAVWIRKTLKFGRLEIGKVVRYLPDQKTTKFRLALQLSVLRGSRPKSTRVSPRQCTQSAPDFIQIGSLSAELYPNAWTPSERAGKWIQYSAEA